MFFGIKRSSKTWKLLIALFFTTLPFKTVFAVEIQLMTSQPTENSEIKLAIVGIAQNNDLILQLTSRNSATTDHPITWLNEDKGEVMVNNLRKGAYIASLINTGLSKHKPLRVKAFIVGGK